MKRWIPDATGRGAWVGRVRSLLHAISGRPAPKRSLPLPRVDPPQAGGPGRNGDRGAGRGVSRETRLEIERWGRERLEAALLEGRLIFEAGPREAHIAFNNYCNMSCIMCWNGANPPLVKMSPGLVARFEEQVAPWLSVMTPYDGSEPLIAGWETTRSIAGKYSIELCLTTNVEYLDERRFRQLQDITETLYLSIDSHLLDVFERIRPGSNPTQVFANLPKAAALANEREIECQANVVFLTLNAPHLHETVGYLADAGVPAVHVLQMLDVNGKSGEWNPLVRLSSDELISVKRRCLQTAREKRIRLVWDVAGLEDHDFRERRIGPTARKAAYDHWDSRMRHLLPGYCRFVRDRLRITVDGSVAPCSFSTDGELELGNLAQDNLADMWNSAKLRDLRRAHLTWDLPAICASCRFSDPAPPEADLPFTTEFLRIANADPVTVPRELEVLDPPHMTRHLTPPVIRIARHRLRAARYTLVLALGGEAEHLKRQPVEPGSDEDGALRFSFPKKLWRRLRPNLGYWWEVMASDPATGAPIARSTEIRCLIRHRAIARVSDSGLRYPDQGHLPVVDLGSVKAGGKDRVTATARPTLGARRFEAPWDDSGRPQT